MPEETSLALTEDPPSVRGKERKREWFLSKYGREEDRIAKCRPNCKFFETTGKCRNGETCRFIHDTTNVIPRRIDQPCRFLYTAPFRCGKDQSCHFSHDLSLFPCPHRNVRRGGSCPPFCKFDHKPLHDEASRMAFVRTYHSLLVSLADTVDPSWKFYLHDVSEIDIVKRQVRQSPDNLFNVIVSSLESAPWRNS